MRQVNKIIIHCAYTPPSMNIGAKEIGKWHTDKGWRAIGYHYIIRRSGEIEAGRPEEQIGAHVIGYNTDSIGVCLVGGKKQDEAKPEFNFTSRQIISLQIIVASLKIKYPKARVYGHNDFAHRECPCFNVQEFMA